jgi:predicted nucleic acid-binding Zn ribbon protein
MSKRCPYCDYPNFNEATVCRRCKKDLPQNCPGCGAMIQEGAAFCSSCGQLFEKNAPKEKPSLAAFGSSQDREKQAEVFKPKPLAPCPNCGQRIPVDAKTCTYCGKIVPASEPDPSQSRTHTPGLKAEPVKSKSGPAGEEDYHRAIQEALAGSTGAAIRFGSLTLKDVRSGKKATGVARKVPRAAKVVPAGPPLPRPKLVPPVAKPKSATTEAAETEQVKKAPVPPRPRPHVVPPPEPKPEPKPVEAPAEPEVEEVDEAVLALRKQRISIKEVRKLPVKTRTRIVRPEYLIRNAHARLPKYLEKPVPGESVHPPEGMVHIPAGQYATGLNHTPAELADFLIDLHPVTSGEYFEFCEKTRHPKPAHWGDGKPLRGMENHPVTNVDVNGARAFASWIGKRLPTESEWEKAAGGTDGRMFPWGEDFDYHKCACRNSSDRRLTEPVDAHPEGAGPYGCLDMVGNAAEWTESLSTNGNGQAPAVLRGGSLLDGPSVANCRTGIVVRVPEFTSYQIGFRCAKDIEI